MTDAERAELRELAECGGTVWDAEYSRRSRSFTRQTILDREYKPEERARLRELEKQGLVMLAWVLTSKGKVEAMKP